MNDFSQAVQEQTARYMRNRLNSLLLNPNAPEVCATQSFDNYHVPGLTYLNLHRTDEETCKLYLFEPGEWQPMGGFYVVHPHDHAYGFVTTVLAGSVVNRLFDEGHSFVHHPEDADYAECSRWTFQSRIGFSDPQPVKLYTGESKRYFTDGTYGMPPDMIHTISVNMTEPTVLFLIEFKTEREKTKCFVPTGMQPPTLDGLYTPMSVERYNERLKRVRQLGGL